MELPSGPSEDIISSEHVFERDSEERWTPMSVLKMVMRNLLFKWRDWVKDVPNVDKLIAEETFSVFNEVLQRLQWPKDEKTV